VAVTVIIPIAGYFLILGLLNTRGRPILLRSSEDSLLLLGTLSLLLLPVSANWIGEAASAGVLIVALAGGGWWVMRPNPTSWVIYNASRQDVVQAIGRALRTLSVDAKPSPEGFALSDGVRLVVRSFPLLRNASIRLRGESKDLSATLERALSRTLADVPAEPNRAAAACVLLATLLLVVPVVQAADGAVQIVRIVSDLMP